MKFIWELLKSIFGKATKVISGAHVERVRLEGERERREHERQEREKALNREDIKQWRAMISELKQKNNSERDNSSGTRLKDLLEGHKDFESLRPYLSEDTKSSIEFQENFQLYKFKDDVLKLITKDIDKIEKRLALAK